MLGGFFIGWLSDHTGRGTVIIAASLIYGVGMYLSCLLKVSSNNYVQMAWFWVLKYINHACCSYSISFLSISVPYLYHLSMTACLGLSRRGRMHLMWHILQPSVSASVTAPSTQPFVVIDLAVGRSKKFNGSEQCFLVLCFRYFVVIHHIAFNF